MHTTAQTATGGHTEGVAAGRQAGSHSRAGRQAGRRAGSGVSSGTRWQQVYLGPHPAPVATVPGPVCGMGSARVRGPSLTSQQKPYVGLVWQCPIHSQMTAGCDRVGVWADVKHRKERTVSVGRATVGGSGQPASRRPNTPRSSVCHHLTIGLGVSSPDTHPTTGGGARPGGCAWWMSHNEWGDWRPGGERWTASDFWIPSTRTT